MSLGSAQAKELIGVDRIGFIQMYFYLLKNRLLFFLFFSPACIHIICLNKIVHQHQIQNRYS